MKAPVLHWQDVCKKLQRFNWKVRTDDDNHVTMVKDGVKYIISIPRHKEISLGVIRKIIKLSGKSIQEFINEE